MDEKLISKKELLERYAISYGALYRWKRMGLIPEEWFIKKATVTGQETFFPEQLICERVELIQSKKDECSLDDMAAQFSSKAEKEPVLIIKTVYGDKVFKLGEINAVHVDRGNGRTDDLTVRILRRKNTSDN